MRLRISPPASSSCFSAAAALLACARQPREMSRHCRAAAEAAAMRCIAFRSREFRACADIACAAAAMFSSVAAGVFARRGRSYSRRLPLSRQRRQPPLPLHAFRH